MIIKINKNDFSSGVNLERFKADLVAADLKGIVERIDDKVTHLFINGEESLNNVADKKLIDDAVKDHDGSDMQTKGYGESDGESSTTSTAFQPKLKLTITNMAAGDYLVSYMAEIKTVDSGVVRTQIQIDDTTVIGTPEYSGSNPVERNGVSGFKKITLTAADHDFDIDFKTKNSGEDSKIRNARIRVREFSV